MTLALTQMAGVRRFALFLVLTLGVVGGTVGVMPATRVSAQTSATPTAEDEITITGSGDVARHALLGRFASDAGQENR